MSEIADKKLRLSEAGKKGMLKRWQENKKNIEKNINDCDYENIDSETDNNSVITTLNKNHNHVITSKGKERKGKEIKEKEIKEKEIKNLCPKNFFEKIDFFYKNEIENNKNNQYIKEYEYLFKYLKNEIKNEINEPITAWLSLKNQITYEQFEKLKILSIQNKVKILDMIKLGENVPSYLIGKKQKTSMYLTLQNWLKSNINFTSYNNNNNINDKTNILKIANPYIT
jgi:hypothetical protein